MQIHLIAIGTRMPAWVEQGFEDYAKRMPPQCRLRLIEVTASKRTKHTDIEKAVEQEGRRMLAAIPENTRVVALEVSAKQYNTESFAQRLDQWMHGGQDISILIGGPEGLARDCRLKALEQWSLSNLTLPHPLVRIVVAEQVYRAWSILNNHPYHR
jgi:23S rRNA (pseudouridine1915-N3)-methyltransferase